MNPDPGPDIPRLFHFCLAAIALPFLAGAAEPHETRTDRGFNPPVLTVYTENDKYYGGTDQYYTNGAQITLISPELEAWEEIPDGGALGLVPRWLARNIRRVSWLREHREQLHVGLAFSQYMFTPEDITDPTPPASDRPYAGWLNLGFQFHAKGDNILDSAELNIGWVGPGSLAEPTQKFVHDLIDAPEPLGWHTQLRNEPTLNLFLERKWRTSAAQTLNGWGVDAILHGGGALGNAHIYLNAGFELRAGYNLPPNFGSSMMRGAASPPISFKNLPSVDRNWRERVSLHAFTGFDGRVVGRNLFLDGNTFSGSRSVDKEPLVGDLRAGITAHFQSFRFSWTMVFRTKEFERQPEAARYGSIAITVPLP